MTISSMLGRAGAAVLLVTMLAACASGPKTGSAAALQSAQAAAQTYQLSPGDKVNISVFGEDNLSGGYTISPDGNITLPLAGPVKAAGLTIPQLQQAVVAVLEKGYVRQPSVSVAAVNLRPYYILGQVNKPGRYSYVPSLTVMDAVATAEGFTYRADTNYVFIRHANNPSEKEYALTPTTAVRPGDTIRVAERYF